MWLFQGLAGCGIVIASGLARYGLGDSLYTAARMFPAYDYNIFIKTWRLQVRDALLADPSGYLGRRHFILAESLSPSFPRRDIVDAYVRPLTSVFNLPPNFVSSHPPDIGRLTALYELHFGFGTRPGIYEFLRNNVWKGLALRILIHEALCNDAIVPDDSFGLDLVPVGIVSYTV